MRKLDSQTFYWKRNGNVLSFKLNSLLRAAFLLYVKLLSKWWLRKWILIPLKSAGDSVFRTACCIPLSKQCQKKGLWNRLHVVPMGCQRLASWKIYLVKLHFLSVCNHVPMMSSLTRSSVATHLFIRNSQPVSVICKLFGYMSAYKLKQHNQGLCFVFFKCFNKVSNWLEIWAA